MHSPDAPAATPTADSQAVDRRDLDSARARLQLPLAIDARWTACPAAANELVIDPDGSTRTCEHGATPLAAPDGAKGPLATWRGDEATTIRAQLAAGHLPLPHCGGCAVWLANDLLPQAPPLRDHGATAIDPARTTPRTLVLRLPANLSEILRLRATES